MADRRITISRRGEVKLNGKPTRWKLEPCELGWRVRSPLDQRVIAWSPPSARAYFATLTDEELLG